MTEGGSIDAHAHDWGSPRDPCDRGRVASPAHGDGAVRGEEVPLVIRRAGGVPIKAPLLTSTQVRFWLTLREPKDQATPLQNPGWRTGSVPLPTRDTGVA